jgi:excinuclease UvrABC nuclease subunit
MKDRFGTVIYVGKARDLRKRVSQYFHPSRRMGWDLKFNALVEAICDFDFHVVRSEPEAFCSKASSSRNSSRATTSVSATTNGS